MGSVDVVGAKNSVLKLMAAALLAEGTTTLTNCPEILDVPLMADVLRSLGCGVTVERDTVAIDVPDELGAEADYRSVSRLRASVCVLGPLVARCRRAVVPLPGGDAIGSRPLDMHQAGLQQARRDHGDRARPRRRARRDAARGADLAGLPERRRHGEHPHGGRARRRHHRDRQRGPRAGDRRPRARCCTQMGAKIEGIGTSTLTVHGVTALQPTEHRVIGDRIVGRHLGVRRGDDPGRGHRARRRPAPPRPRAGQAAQRGRGRPRRARRSSPCGWTAAPGAIDFVTLPYPGFATDLQPMAIALSAVADGTSMITENVFEARFRFVDEMVRLGADARTDGHHAVVRGVRAAVQRAGVGERHPRRRRAGARGPVRGRRDRRCGTSSTSTAATRGSWRTCRASARTSRGCSTDPL